MAGLLIPHRWREQPQVPTRIDWRHPLARGLVYYVIGNAANAPDLVSGSMGIPIGSAALTTTTAHGRALSSGNTSSSGWYYNYDLERVRSITNEFTIAVDYRGTAFTTTSTVIALPHTTGSAGTPTASIKLRGSQATSTMFLDMAYSGSAERTASFANGFGPTGEQSFVSASRSGANVVFIRNGVEIASSSNSFLSANTVNFNTGQTVTLMNRSESAQGSGLAGGVNVAALWSRALSASEQMSFQLNPYQLLRPLTAKPYVVASTAPPATFTATGAVSVPMQVASGTATFAEARTATGSATIPMQAASGTAFLSQTFAGAGAVSVPTQTVAGSAVFEEAPPVVQTERRIATMGRDKLGRASETVSVGTAQSVGYSATHGATTPLLSSVVRIVCTTPAYVAIGPNAVATTTDVYMPANWPELVNVPAGSRISAIRVSGDGTLHVMEAR